MTFGRLDTLCRNAEIPAAYRAHSHREGRFYRAFRGHDYSAFRPAFTPFMGICFMAISPV